MTARENENAPLVNPNPAMMDTDRNNKRGIHLDINIKKKDHRSKPDNGKAIQNTIVTGLHSKRVDERWDPRTIYQRKIEKARE